MRRAIAALVLTIAGLIPLWRYHPGSAKQAGAEVNASAPPESDPSTGPSPSESSGPAPSPDAAGQKTVDGPVVRTEFGPYQVRATVAGGKLLDVGLITEPSDRHSQRIAGEAAPTLRQEALRAQSARIDTVSGATTTSEAYSQSLQAALDGAK